MSNTHSDSAEHKLPVNLEELRELVTREVQRALESALRKAELRLVLLPALGSSAPYPQDWRGARVRFPFARTVPQEWENLRSWPALEPEDVATAPSEESGSEFAISGLSEADETSLLRWCDGQLLEGEELARVRELLRSSPEARELCDAGLPSSHAGRPGRADLATRAFEAAVFGAAGDSPSPGVPDPRIPVAREIGDKTNEWLKAGGTAIPDASAPGRTVDEMRPAAASNGLGALDSNNAAADLRARLLDSAQGGRRPVLIVGSGILSQSGYGPLADWTALLRAVATQHDLPFDDAFASEQPTMFWESMLVFAAKRDQLQANQVEARLLRTVGQLLETQDGKCAYEPFRTLIGSEFFQAIVALNFTVAPLLDSAAKGVRASVAPFPNFDGPNCKVWCPHGHHSLAASMRLGARRYSLLAGTFEHLRAQYHQDRRAGRVGRANGSSDEGVDPGVQFISDVLDSPLVFAGCGLRAAEWTVWWLIATKARNEARYSSCPSVFVTADVVPAAQRAALESMNCRVLKTKDYSEVWAFVDQIASCRVRRSE